MLVNDRAYTVIVTQCTTGVLQGFVSCGPVIRGRSECLICPKVEALDRALQCSVILFTDQFGDGIRQLTHRLGLPLKEKQERRFGQSHQFQLAYSEHERLNDLLEEEITFVNRLRDYRHGVFMS